MAFGKLGLTLFVCAWLASCGQGGCVIFNHPVAPDGGPCRFDELRFESFLVVGEEAQVEFGLDENCYADIQEVFPVRLTAEVEVLDPGGKPVAHTDAAPERRKVGSSHFEDVVKVTFTPDRPGTWRLSADFGPDFGKTAQSIEVVQWRGDARTRVIPWQVPPECVGYEFTDRETALCLQFFRAMGSMPSAPRVTTSRGEVFDGRAFAVSGNTMWRLTSFNGDPGIERLEDDGTAFQVTHRTLSQFATSGALVVNGNEAWLLGTTLPRLGPVSLLRLLPQQDGGVSIEEAPVPGKGAARVALGREALLVLTEERQLALVALDGGLLGVGKTGSLVGADPEALWFEENVDPFADPNGHSDAQDLKVAWVEDGGLHTAKLALPRVYFLNLTRRAHFGAPLVPMSAVSAGPDAGIGQVTVPRLDGAKLSLESFDAGADFAPVSAATTRHAFARSLDGKALKIFDR